MAEMSEQERTGLSRRTLLAGAAVGGAGLAAALSDPGAVLGAAAGENFVGSRPLAAEGEPGVGLRFEVQAAGRPTLAGFQKVGGLSVEIEVVEYREGSEPDAIRKLPGQAKYPNIELSRPLTADPALAAWIGLVQDGEIAQARKNGSILALNQKGTEIARWNFVNGWPSKWELEDLNVGGTEVLMETITVTVEHLSRVRP